MNAADSMSASSFVPTPAGLIAGWLTTRLAPEAAAWHGQLSQQVAAGEIRPLYLGFSLMPRKTGKADLSLNATELAQASSVIPGWTPTDWTTDDLGRWSLLLAYPAADAAALVKVLEQLFATGEVRELICLYRGLCLLPWPEAHAPRLAEGIRSNIRGVLTAIAHANPLPAKVLSEAAWNQLVLKCLFNDLPLYKIQGFDQRANQPLSLSLIDFAKERLAAGRSFNPELFRGVAGHAPIELRAFIEELPADHWIRSSPAIELALPKSTSKTISFNPVEWDKLGASWEASLRPS